MMTPRLAIAMEFLDEELIYAAETHMAPKKRRSGLRDLAKLLKEKRDDRAPRPISRCDF